MPKRTVNGVSLHYDVAGYDDPPVALLHGFPLDGRAWAGVASEMTARWRVAVPDLRGFGRSFDAAAADAPFSIADLADDVRALLADLDMLPCVVVGLSMGGYVALAFAGRYPADLLALGLVDTKSDADTAEARAGRDEMISLAGEGGSVAVAGKMFPRMVADAHGPMAGRLEKIMVECPAPTIRRALAAMRDRPDYAPVLASLTVPVAVVVGERDAITPPDLARRMAGAVPTAELTVVAGAGHMAPIEQPSAVSAALQRLVERVGG